MRTPLDKRVLAAFVLLVGGCTSIAGLDDLLPGEPLSTERGAGAEPDPARDADAAERDSGRDALSESSSAVEGGRSEDLDAGRDAESSVRDAAPDVIDPTCWLRDDCACNDKNDCPGPAFECCNGRCTDPSSDALHCGTCGNPCPSNQVCDHAECACGGLFPDQACVPNVCIDFMSDPNHCGSCTHSCLGGICLGQACQVVPMATQQQEPMGIAVDAQFVYFANSSGNTIGKLPKGSTVPCAGNGCPLFASPYLDQPVDVVTQDGDPRVYVSNHAGGALGSVIAVAKGPWSGAADIIATGTGLGSLAMRDGIVYFAGAPQGPKSSLGLILPDGGVSPAAHGYGYGSGEVTAVAVDADAVYFGARAQLDGGAPVSGLFKVQTSPGCIGGCAPSLLFAGTRPRSIALNTQFAFWTGDDDKIRRVSKSCLAAPCPVTVLAEGQNDAQSIVADDSSVYWANAAGGGTIRRTPVWSACKGLACQSMTPQLGKVYGLAQDLLALYFTTRSSGPPATGIVWRIAK